jgi:8-oxo-dGTP pyrophosphatase MutT (NUDIX family)
MSEQFPAVAIRPAATVVVVRSRGHVDGSGAGGAEILMLRRSAKSAFMPSTRVFPGGRLEPEDGADDDAVTWARAACRECVEEAGLQLDPASLRWFDTWITPSAESSRRFLARFFLAEAPPDAGAVQADDREVHDASWATADEHLADWQAGRADLPPPTLAILLRLRDLGASLQALVPEDPASPILPKVIARDGAVTILMPHDPDYAAAPGEAAPAPARAAALPCRFVRDKTRWCPC